jgi:hypothetical protein
MCILSLSRDGFSKACYPFSLFLKINILDTKIQIQIVDKNIDLNSGFDDVLYKAAGPR